MQPPPVRIAVPEVDHGDPAGDARERAVSRVFKGVGVSSGVARGVAFVLACGDRCVSPRRDIQPTEVGRERVRLEAALEAAISLGCDYAQGFYLGHPMPADRLADWLAGTWPVVAVTP